MKQPKLELKVVKIKDQWIAKLVNKETGLQACVLAYGRSEKTATNQAQRLLTRLAK